MSSGFGFEPFPQRPSPDPRQVGAALARSRFTSPTAAAPNGPTATAALPASMDPRDRLHQLFRSLTAQAGSERGGPGQTGTGTAPPGRPDYPVADTEAHSAMHAAVGDAVQRLANGVMAPPDATAERSRRRRDHLLKLGLVPFEADLLSRSGGI